MRRRRLVLPLGQSEHSGLWLALGNGEQAGPVISASYAA